jgi:hypothetical protein
MLLFALSMAGLGSQACTLERQYAAALGKLILPVMLGRVTYLPEELAEVQYTDYSEPSERAAFRLAGAIFSLPPTSPLPSPLPDPPAMPTSYLSDLARRIHAPTLDQDQQLALLPRLKMALQRSDDDYASTMDLLNEFLQRQDLLLVTYKELQELRATPPPAPSAADVSAAASAASSDPADDWTTIVTMPELGEQITEGTITRWLKKEGNWVEADEPLFEVSTDKVDTEVPSPVSGSSRPSRSRPTRPSRSAPSWP